jgi:hypothetical protein
VPQIRRLTRQSSGHCLSAATGAHWLNTRDNRPVRLISSAVPLTGAFCNLIFQSNPPYSDRFVVQRGGDMQCVATGFNYRIDIPETLDFIDDVISHLP